MVQSDNTAAAARITNVDEIPGLEELWAETLGDPRICIAVIDGSVDRSHPSLVGANLTPVETLVSDAAGLGSASQHGTHVSSVIFGQHDGPVKGIAPRCRGLIVPVFKDSSEGTPALCTQLDLARTITQAVQQGAHIINISGGEFSPSGTAHPLLADVVRKCASYGALIVAATGNEGCECLHVPGALPTVLAVGAMNAEGLPLEFSNWGENYQTQGILATGENILGAGADGGTTINSGTSYATPIVSGVAALLLSLQLKRGQKPNTYDVRSGIIESAIGCEDQTAPDCRRLLAGRLNIKGAVSQLIKGNSTMSDTHEIQEKDGPPVSENDDLKTSTTPDLGVQAAISDSKNNESGASTSSQTPVTSTPTSHEREKLADEGSGVESSSVTTAACTECGGSPCVCDTCKPTQLVFALGKLDFDFVSEARRDSIMQNMKIVLMDEENPDPNPDNPQDLLDYLKKAPWEAASIIWTLMLDSTVIYAIQAQGIFEEEIYIRLRDFLCQQIKKEVERVSIAGYIVGNQELLSGEKVPNISLLALRGMFSWNTLALVKEVCGSPPSRTKNAQPNDHEKCKENVKNFLVRVYQDLRNLGIAPQDRAINYAATNALPPAMIFRDAIKEDMVLHTIDVKRSPICRPESDCWDVELIFFNPKKVFEQARKVYLFTVDVSDVVPVTVGEVRSWFLYVYP